MVKFDTTSIWFMVCYICSRYKFRVEASAKYGREALQIATTVKLERALWIVPLSLLTSLFVKGNKKKIYIPYFIGLFILSMIIGTYFRDFSYQYSIIEEIAKKDLTVTLFLIGAGLSLENIKAVGINPFIQ